MVIVADILSLNGTLVAQTVVKIVLGGFDVDEHLGMTIVHNLHQYSGK